MHGESAACVLLVLLLVLVLCLFSSLSPLSSLLSLSSFLLSHFSFLLLSPLFSSSPLAPPPAQSILAQGRECVVSFVADQAKVLLKTIHLAKLASR